jgi:carbonic anhydrase
MPSQKPSPERIVAMLKEGNTRFLAGTSIHPNCDAGRLALAGQADQGDYAYATILTCSDSRVPPELIFDTGLMDIFMIRVAGNVCNTDEIGSIEYGLAHVHTPVLIVLGHTQCGAVTAVLETVCGHSHALERNIPALVAPIRPAVERAMAQCAALITADVMRYAIEENIWQGIENLFMASPVTRNLVNEGKAKVIGAIYDVGTGQVEWLPEARVTAILKSVEASPERAMNVMAD